jgi:class 3 adenylate cyclase/predicted ATPase
MDIGEWLRGLDLGQYENLFQQNDVDAEVLFDLTEGDFEKIGVSLGHRKRLLKAIAALAISASAQSAVNAPNSTAADAAERRQLTVMFCDLVGSTALSAQRDPEDMRRLIRAYQDACSGVVARYDGFVAKFMGDGILAYFGFPRAHEDDASRAVHAGLELVEVIAGLKPPAGEKLAARIGIATGLVVVGDIVGQGPAQEQAVVGDTPNLAARLQGLADAGGIVISAATRRLIGDRFRLRDIGRHALKGLPEPVEAFSALGVSQSDSRFEAAHAARLTGFVGRQAEAADLLARQRRAWGGYGQIVLISGEAGIGKSRMSAWLAEQVAETPHTRLRYQCSPYHRDSALHPFAQQFERAAGLTAQDNSEAKLDKLEKVLSLATDQLGEVAPLVAAMLSIPTGNRYPTLNLSPAQQRRHTLFALIDQMEGLAKGQPLLMLFEDAHWADATSLEVLDLAIERMRKLPVLLLITFRSEFETPWKGLPNVTDIVLGRLERNQAEALVERVTGGRKLPAEVLAQIVAKTDGVPLFVEELTKNVLESGLLIEEAGHYRLDGPLPPLAIPSTLQDSLMARLDRLAAVKEIAQIGAAIGREFSYPLLQAVVGRDEATLKASLAQLEDSELVFSSGEPPNARYTFKHALVQDTAYESLLKSRRQILHRKIAESLRERFAAVAEAEPELLAHHFTQAGLTEPAIEYWGKAGDLAQRRSAFKEAIAHLGKAIEMTEAAGKTDAEKTGGKLKLQVAFGNALIAHRGYGASETKMAWERARETTLENKNAPEQLSVSYGLWAVACMSGNSSVRQNALNFLRDVNAISPSPVQAVAHRCLGLTCCLQGRFSEARSHLEQALAIFDPTRDGDLAFAFGNDSGIAASYLALTLWPIGNVDDAREQNEKGAARARQITHTPSIAFTYVFNAGFEIMTGDMTRLATLAEALAGLLLEHDLGLMKVFSTVLSGASLWSNGDRKAGLVQLRAGVAGMRESNVAMFYSLFDVLLARAESETGALDIAIANLDQCCEETERTAQTWYDAEIHRARGEILQRQNPADPSSAEAAFLTAIAVAQSQKARSFELRAALGLAKLYRSTDRDVDAHAALAQALKGFSPTPEFPEIEEALSVLASTHPSATRVRTARVGTGPRRP